MMENLDVRNAIERLKMKKLDFLTKEEVEEILINAREKSFFKKRAAFKDGMKLGLRDADDLFKVYANGDIAQSQNFTESQRDFFEASIKRVEKKLEKTGDFIVDCDWPSQALMDYFDDGMMRLCYVKNLYGLDISDAQTFIEYHGGLESVAPKQLVKKENK